MSATVRSSVLRDPVHGDVLLTHEELKLLDTPQMQRLRGVKQLGSADLVYPGARHSRFEHSIGTAHLSQQIVDAVNRAADLAPRDCLRIGDAETRVIRVAALLHDITHIPYGHHFEDQAGLLHRHDSPERYERMLDASTGIGAALRQAGLLRDVLAVLCDRDDTPPYWRQINSDTICSDILDYLARDAYFTGLRIGIDSRLLAYFRVERASGNLYLDLAKHNLLREDIVSEIVRILEARYYFSERVYYHHAKVAAGALIARAVEISLAEKLIEESDLYATDDASLLELLDRGAARAKPALARRVRSLVERYRRRRLPKRACVFPRPQNQDAQQELVERYFSIERHADRSRAEERIADLVRFATGRDVEIMLVCPAKKMQLKEVATHVLWPGEDAVRPLAAYADRAPRLFDLERAYRDLWKFYVFADADEPDLLARVAEIAASEFPSAQNVYRPGRK